MQPRRCMKLLIFVNAAIWPRRGMFELFFYSSVNTIPFHAIVLIQNFTLIPSRPCHKFSLENGATAKSFTFCFAVRKCPVVMKTIINKKKLNSHILVVLTFETHRQRYFGGKKYSLLTPWTWKVPTVEGYKRYKSAEFSQLTCLF